MTFDVCTALVGGKGTAYDDSHTDYTYAHIDGGVANPGYFTEKDAPAVADAQFDGLVLTVGGDMTMTDALAAVGGRDMVAATVAAVRWESTVPLTEEMLEGLDNPNLLVYVSDAALAPAGRDNVVVNGQAGNVVLTDAASGNNNFYAPQAFTAETISYTRNFEQSTQRGVCRGWETIALPFTVQTIRHSTQGDIAPFGATASNRHFWLRRLGSSGLTRVTRIEANTPYLISMPNSTEYSASYNLSGEVTFAAANATVPATRTVVRALADSSLVMMPTMQRLGRSSSVWALNVGEVRGQYLEGSVFERNYREVRPFEAYTVHRDGLAPRFVPLAVMAEDEATGISDATLSGSQGAGAMYDLSGRRVEQERPAKGVYIRGGRKHVVR